jgi:predicted transcriptional regulator
MTATKLREKIYEELQKVTDEQLLQEVYSILNLNSEAEEIHKVNEAERKAIDDGLGDIETGKVYTSQKTDELIQSWLKK